MCTLWQIPFFSLFFSIQVLGSSVLYAITIVFDLKKKTKERKKSNNRSSNARKVERGVSFCTLALACVVAQRTLFIIVRNDCRGNEKCVAGGTGGHHAPLASPLLFSSFASMASMAALEKKAKKKQTETPLPFFFLCRAALFEFSPYTEVGLSLSSIEMNSPLIVRKSAATADLEDMTAMRKTKKERKSCG